MSSASQVYHNQKENLESNIHEMNSNTSNENDNNNHFEITKHPSLIRLSKELIDDESIDEIISFVSEYPKLQSLKEYLDQENPNYVQLNSTQKVIILLGTAFGLQYLHINDLHHGDLCSKNIFLDENYYPHIYMPNLNNHEASFTEKDKNVINDITSLCFISYELIIGHIVFDENQKNDEKLMNFDLDKTQNDWQKKFLQSFWPSPSQNLDINDIIIDLINNKKKFGEIEEDKIMAYIEKFKNFQLAYLQILEKEANDDNTKKMLIYGRMLLNYPFMNENDKKAAKYFKKAARLGDTNAMYEYAMILIKIKGPYHKKVEKYLLKALNNEHIGATYEYGRLSPYKKGIKYLKKAADNGYLRAQFWYGNSIEQMTLTDALTYYKCPADFGYPIAMNNLAVFFSDMDKKDYEEADYISMSIKYFKMAISLGNVQSFFNFGTYLFEEPKNVDEGLKYIKYAAEMGSIDAIEFYKDLVLKDETYENNLSDISDLIKYTKIAADKGDDFFMNFYGYILYKGIFVEKDTYEARRYFQLAFLDDHQNYISMFIYGKILLEDFNDEEGNYYIEECIKNEYSPALTYVMDKSKKVKIKTEEEIIAECKNLADKGDSEAMYLYAVMLYNGEGIEVNKEEAAKYYQMAAEKGHIGSMNNYANMLYYGDGIKEDISEALTYYILAADKGHDISTCKAGIFLYKDFEYASNKEKCLYYIQKAIEYGFTYPKTIYDDLIKKGEIKEEIKSKKAFRLRKEIHEGNVDSMFSFALMLLNGDGIYKSRKDAAEYFKMAAEKGHLGAMEQYGLMLLNGNGISMNKKEAAKWLKLSADRGRCTAMFYYAKILSNGDGIKKNKAEAAKYYKRAADQGHIFSMNNYGVMLNYGDGIEVNKEVGLKYLKKAFDCGDDMGKLNYAVIQKNKKDKDDNNKSIKYFKELADDGNNSARILYGNYLKKGVRIPMDKKEAAKYFKMAADDGSIDGMMNYAKMMGKGDGVPLNIQEAIKYYQKALIKNGKKASEKLKQLSLFYSCCL